MNDYEFIRKFTDVSIKNICSDLHLEKDYRNIMSGRAKSDKLKKVRKEIERRLNIIYDTRE